MKTAAELKLEFDEADRICNAANRARLDAQRAWRQALLEETGLAGCVVEYTRYTWRNKAGTKIRFLVDRMANYSTTRVAGPIVKVNGEVGERIEDAGITDLRIIKTREEREARK